MHGFLLDGFRQGVQLIISLDREILSIVWLTLAVSVISTAVSTLIGIPVGSLIAMNRFRGKKAVIAIVNTGMGLPPVVVGLIVVLLLSRNGPLGYLEWLYTPSGIILAQIIIAVPVITGLSLSAVQGIDPKLLRQIAVLGATRCQTMMILMRERKVAFFAAVIAGFGSVISEVGAVMMVGGNIKGQTRVLTTATVMETRIGNFEMAIALGMILLMMSFIVTAALTFIQQKKSI